MFGIIKQIKSVSLIITEIKTSDEAKELGLIHASKSMYSEAFTRYDPSLFRAIFYQLLMTLSFLSVPEIRHLGQILLVDGSLFPAIRTMRWASYKTTAKAIKMHLAYSLNRMIPVEFLVKEANYSEKSFLSDILEEGMTYVCDRGYISFKIFAEICKRGAFFIIRGKSKMIYSSKEQLIINIPANFMYFFTKIKDMKVTFFNDKSQNTYRIVQFTALGERYVLITNRLDLTTYEIIMLYAYRWQIELFFRFMKRTLNGIHLFTHDENGIQVQFYLYMIAHLLLLAFKQECEQISGEHKVNANRNTTDGIANEQSDPETGDNIHAGRVYARGLVSMLGKKLQKYWKIGIHWLTVLKTSLTKIFDIEFVLKITQYR